MNKLVILKAEIPQTLNGSEVSEMVEYLNAITPELNRNNVNIDFKLIIIPSDKFNISVLYPNVAITKKELNKIIDEQNQNIKILNSLDDMTKDRPELNRSVKLTLRKLKLIEISDF